jgi:hypothetical protein
VIHGPRTFKVPIEGNDTQHEANEREGRVDLVRRGRHCALECGAMDKNDGRGSALELIRVELGLRESRNVSVESSKSKPTEPTRVQGLTC